MLPHQNRVVAELESLNGMIERLSAFLAGPIFATVDMAEQDRLTRQVKAMREYASILAERIAAF